MRYAVFALTDGSIRWWSDIPDGAEPHAPEGMGVLPLPTGFDISTIHVKRVDVTANPPALVDQIAK